MKVVGILLISYLALLQKSGACTFYKADYDHGEDYISWTSVSSLNSCKDKCKSTAGCSGLTWVKNYKRNCALYDNRGTGTGVYRRGQNSYINCNPKGYKIYNPPFLFIVFPVQLLLNILLYRLRLWRKYWWFTLQNWLGQEIEESEPPFCLF